MYVIKNLVGKRMYVMDDERPLTQSRLNLVPIACIGEEGGWSLLAHALERSAEAERFAQMRRRSPRLSSPTILRVLASHDVAASPSSSSGRQRKQASYSSIQVSLAVSCRRGSDAASSGAGVEATIDIVGPSVTTISSDPRPELS